MLGINYPSRLHKNSMFTRFGEQLHDKTVFWSSIIILGDSVISFILIGLRWHRLPPVVPLWYSRAWGVDQLAPSLWLIILPLGVICWYIVTAVVGVLFAKEHQVFLHVLFLAALLVSIMSLVTLFNILHIIT